MNLSLDGDAFIEWLATLTLEQKKKLWAVVLEASLEVLLEMAQTLTYRMYQWAAISVPYNPKSIRFWYHLWKKLSLWNQKEEVSDGNKVPHDVE